MSQMRHTGTQNSMSQRKRTGTKTSMFADHRQHRVDLSVQAMRAGTVTHSDLPEARSAASAATRRAMGLPDASIRWILENSVTSNVEFFQLSRVSQ